VCVYPIRTKPQCYGVNPYGTLEDPSARRVNAQVNVRVTHFCRSSLRRPDATVNVVRSGVSTREDRLKD